MICPSFWHRGAVPYSQPFTAEKIGESKRHFKQDSRMACTQVGVTTWCGQLPRNDGRICGALAANCDMVGSVQKKKLLQTAKLLWTINKDGPRSSLV
jgi:hypothetical protein